ncbi:uncharacterized protein PITG_08177 [Phytophthora infestans T30-4]|uniref:Tyrosinase copper-binding domain-containing protein n=1 Tax=Phytophthora infestans (strain T30-4) TaxID=403677 RepID=D0N9M9_PHYIT|nr:uncharacterized protein PITG_08177 [Phytophthora infestans T30-4]EEY54517.1 conserved hypothetical protein [Phytophthora infestans T30-4]|eukprot:XP_002904339.1 conserved hypothetical protein [Phytophthora infestans T30-4]
MTAVEKSTYKGALAAAMDSGAYIKFVEIHTEMKSEMEAHKQCMFIYWHRLFLVVFENMLRGQGPEYACVTIPYFNWIETSNKALSGECKTLGDCSPIMKELGGLTGNTQQTVVINGKNITGTCVSNAPLDHFCSWGSAKVPASISYASVIGQLFNGTNIEKVSRTVERGCHADIHAALGSTMAKFQCPADPIFWSHHAMLDALLTIFHKCRVGTRRMTFEEKAADPVAWASCKRRVRKNPTGPPFKPTDAVAMRTGENGSNPIEASEDPVIGRYLKGVPNRFADLMDGSDLGTNSYTDEINGLLAVMYNTCGGTEPHSVPVVIAFNLTRSEKRMMNWYNETMSLNGGQSIADMKRQICMFHDQCLGGIVDYTDDFKALWGVKEPRCKTIVNAISNGEQKIVDSAWKSKMEAHFGCPHPVNKTVTREFE